MATLELQYPHMLTATIAAMFERPLVQVYAKASQLGLHKSPEFMASPAAGRTSGRQGMYTRFTKGMTPWNKGLHYKAGGRSAQTRFRKGHRPHTWKPIGSERINADGYRDRKMSDTGYPPRDWVAIHRMNWIAVHGPIPAGHIVTFKDGNKLNAAIENLQMLTLRENMLRNTIHVRYPKPVRQVIQLAGALRRQINRRTRHE